MNNSPTAHQPDDLPVDKSQALQKLIKISEKLVALAEQETQALVQNDMVAFAILQQEKELLSKSYVHASEQFRGRLAEFRDANRAQLQRLEDLQNQLGEKTQSNNAVVVQIQQRAEKNTQETLITAQELAQQKPVRLNEDNSQYGGA